MSRRYSDDDFGTIKDVELKDLFRRKKPVDKPVIIALVFFTVLFLLAAFITLSSSSGRSDSYNDFMSDAVMVTAKCSNVRAEHSSRYNEYYADISYEYNGTVYRGSQVRIGQMVSEGDVISIYVYPNDPSNIRRSDNTGEGLLMETVIGYCLFGVGGLLFFITLVVVVNNIRLNRRVEDGSSIYHDEPIEKPKREIIDTYSGYNDSSTFSDTSGYTDTYNSSTNRYNTYNDNGYNNYTDNSFSYSERYSEPDNVENTLKYNGPKDDISNDFRNDSGNVSASQNNKTLSKKELIRVIRIVIFLIIFVQLTFSCLTIIPAIIQKADNDNFMKTAVSTEGVCDSVRVKEHHSSHGSGQITYIYYARIKYKFEDQYYLSNEIEIEDGIAKGESYTLYVDPNNPSDARKPYVLNMFEIIMYSGLAVFVTTIGLVFYRGLKKAIEEDTLGAEVKK